MLFTVSPERTGAAGRETNKALHKSETGAKQTGHFVVVAGIKLTPLGGRTKNPKVKWESLIGGKKKKKEKEPTDSKNTHPA